jgi:hypothetical protein
MTQYDIDADRLSEPCDLCGELNAMCDCEDEGDGMNEDSHCCGQCYRCGMPEVFCACDDPTTHIPAHWNANGFLVIDLRDPARAREELQALLAKGRGT